MERRISIHVPGDWIGGPGLLPFYRRLAGGLDARGVPYRFVPIERAGLPDRVAGDTDYHIVNHGRVRHPRVLNAGVAYIYPYWHLDPSGIRSFASIGTLGFDPGAVDGPAAQAFFRQMVKRQVRARRSRYEQPEAVEPLPRGCIAVFLQSEGHRGVGETLWLDRWQMLRACLNAAGERAVVVKPHPLDRDPELFEGLAALQAADPRLVVSFANIHDILAAADRVVTINSAVGIEALLHRRPVILCGQADFHHICDEARTEAALDACLAAPPRPRPFARYVYWYFAGQCLNAGAPDLADRVLDRVRATG